ncbi:hypothetical protein ACTXL1_06830 [Psychrobacter celer]|uniref:hypothetical protein n=1 Tax=Psychrobacter celer TaxID=306572 RepID=UPI003FD5C5BC
MPHKINIEMTPSTAEDQLLSQKAAERGMDVDTFTTWLIEQSLARTNADISHIIKH